jgi:NADPH:quinone reductase-like Zn-dependent oxidoreductase
MTCQPQLLLLRIMLPTIRAYSATSKTFPLVQSAIQRRDVGPGDVQIDILYCGVCHSDLHQARDEWHNTIYPCVPGHEIVGRVVKTGRDVKSSKKVIWRQSAAWWIPVALVPVAGMATSSTVTILQSSRITARINIWAE